MQTIAIWGNCIPGNSADKKETVMELKSPRLRNATKDLIDFILALKGDKYRSSAKKVFDTYVHTWVKNNDPDYHDTFEDTPYLIPYIAPGSRKAVIVVPGGGFCYKSMSDEGTKIAEKLCASGITAFVLWYRSNPYYMPYPLMDMQRAIRYVRFHANDYGYDPHQIGAIGFSAGGAQVAMHANVLRRGLIELPDYTRDEVDETDDALNTIGLVYPALNFHPNPSLFVAFPAELVRNPAQRKAITKVYDALGHMSTQGIPHFISYGTKDDMVSLSNIQAYVEKLKDSQTPYAQSVLEGLGHGYGASQEGWLGEYICWLQQLGEGENR